MLCIIYSKLCTTLLFGRNFIDFSTEPLMILLSSIDPEYGSSVMTHSDNQ